MEPRAVMLTKAEREALETERRELSARLAVIEAHLYTGIREFTTDPEPEPALD